MQEFGRYAALVLGGIVAWLALAGAFDALVDPYDIVGSPRIAGFNAVKPAIPYHAALAKTYQLARRDPRTLLLGTSRVDIGLDPASALWPAADRPVYDFGIPGTGLTLLDRGLRDAAAAGRLRTVVLGLDFDLFLDIGPPALPADQARRMRLLPDGAPNPARLWQRAHDLLLATLTRGALEDSVATVLAQRDPAAEDVTALGATSENGFRALARSDGLDAVFAQKEVEYAARYAAAARALNGFAGPLPRLAELRDIVAFCRAHGIRLILLIPPVHADLLDIIDAVGLWPRFEQWKIDLAALVAQAAAMPGPPAPVTLWDFSGYDRYATESIPAPPRDRDPDAIRWFWEPVHFRKRLGDRILARVLDAPRQDASFGVVLTPANVVARLAQVRADRADYRAAHRPELARLCAELPVALRLPDTCETKDARR